MDPTRLSIYVLEVEIICLGQLADDSAVLFDGGVAAAIILVTRRASSVTDGIWLPSLALQAEDDVEKAVADQLQIGR